MPARLAAADNMRLADVFGSQKTATSAVREALSFSRMDEVAGFNRSDEDLRFCGKEAFEDIVSLRARVGIMDDGVSTFSDMDNIVVGGMTVFALVSKALNVCVRAAGDGETSSVTFEDAFERIAAINRLNRGPQRGSNVESYDEEDDKEEEDREESEEKEEDEDEKNSGAGQGAEVNYEEL